MTYKSGFTTIIGRPNVGKSTLINKIIGKKISITSPKPQTTRNKIQAVYSTDNGQIVFVDTPGIHKAKNKLDKYMLSQAFKSLEGIDLIIFLVDATSTFGKGDKFIYQQLKETGVPVTVVMNKIDKLDTGTIAARLKNYQKHTNQEVIPVSARSGKNIESLVDNILSNFDEGPQYYPDDMITDQIEQFVISEIIREKIFYLTREEIPYGVAVKIEEMQERDNGLFYIRVYIYVEKKSHKGIIIGKNGSMLKRIGYKARKEIEKLLQTSIYLDLWVKVLKDWREKKNLVKRMGYRE